MPAISERSYPLCVCTIFDDGVRRYTLQSATRLAIEAWLVHLNAWHHEIVANGARPEMRILLDLRSAKSLPIAPITQALPQWQAAHPDCKLYIAAVAPNTSMIKLAQSMIGIIRMHNDFSFFEPTALDEAHDWLNQH